MAIKSQPPTTRAVLPGGGVIELRPLEREDGPVLAAAVERLSPWSRYLRFAAAKPRLTQRDLDALTDVDHHAREALVAIEPRTRRGIGVARYAAIPGEPGAVDVAVTVADEWQGRGLGRLLLVRLLGRAKDEGVVRVRASVLAENTRSLALLRDLGFRSERSERGVVELALALAHLGLPIPYNANVKAA
jgi:RimJ/RimL family protein N-acetyltransferase